MKWLVTYRDKGGEQVQEAFEAGSREELFKVLRDKGIAAIRAEEDKTIGRHPRTARRAVASPSVARLVVWLVIGTGLVICGFFALRGMRDAREEPKEANKRDKTHVTAPVQRPLPTSNKTDSEVPDKKPEPPPYVKKAGQMQLPDGRVLTFRPPREGEFRIVHSHGSTYKCDHLGNWEDITPKPIFDNSFEETLVGLATTGNFIPGILMGIDYDEAIKMLTKPVVVNPDDSEDVVEKKQAVAAAKEAILDYMKDGASLDDFVMEMRKQVVKERFIRGMALKEIVASLKEGRVQDAADTRDAANKMLEKEGAPALKIPAHLENEIEENK